MKVHAVKVLKDNYSWILEFNQMAFCIDPGESDPIIKLLKKYHLSLKCILLTHDHADHIAGIPEILKTFPECLIINHKNHEQIPDILGSKVIVYKTPGHTNNHLSFYWNGHLFSGDSLFHLGCGRIFSGTSEDFLKTLDFYQNFPDEALLCCAHEYSLEGAYFSNWVFYPIDDSYLKIIDHYQLKKQTIPVSFSLEKKLNPFLRTDDLVYEALAQHGFNCSCLNEARLILRKLKDSYQSNVTFFPKK